MASASPSRRTALTRAHQSFDLFPKLKKPLRGKCFRNIEEVSNELTRVIRRINNEGVLTRIKDLSKCWAAVIKHNGDYNEGL